MKNSTLITTFGRFFLSPAKNATRLLATLALLFFVAGAVEAQIPTNGLVAWYPFNGNANDASGNGNNGTVYGATLTTDRFGIANKAYYFNGTSNYIEVGNLISSNPSSYSINIWLNLTENKVVDIISDRDNNCSYKYRIFYSPPGFLTTDGIIQAAIYNVNSYVYSHTEFNVVLGLNNWYLITLNYDVNSSLFQLFLNGVYKSTANSTNWSYLSDPTHIGGLLGCGSPFSNGVHGSLDDIRIYNRALSASEIQALYNDNTDANPVADFTVSPSSGTVPLTVHVTDASVRGSSNIVKWSWDFNGNGVSEATGTKATHTFDKAGKQNIRLTITDATGKSSTISKQVEVLTKITGTVKNINHIALPGATITLYSGVSYDKSNFVTTANAQGNFTAGGIKYDPEMTAIATFANYCSSTQTINLALSGKSIDFVLSQKTLPMDIEIVDSDVTPEFDTRTCQAITRVIVKNQGTNDISNVTVNLSTVDKKNGVSYNVGTQLIPLLSANSPSVLEFTWPASIQLSDDMEVTASANCSCNEPTANNVGRSTLKFTGGKPKIKRVFSNFCPIPNGKLGRYYALPGVTDGFFADIEGSCISEVKFEMTGFKDSYTGEKTYTSTQGYGWSFDQFQYLDPAKNPTLKVTATNPAGTSEIYSIPLDIMIIPCLDPEGTFSLPILDNLTYNDKNSGYIFLSAKFGTDKDGKTLFNDFQLPNKILPKFLHASDYVKTENYGSIEFKFAIPMLEGLKPYWYGKIEFSHKFFGQEVKPLQGKSNNASCITPFKDYLSSLESNKNNYLSDFAKNMRETDVHSMEANGNFSGFLQVNLKDDWSLDKITGSIGGGFSFDLFSIETPDIPIGYGFTYQGKCGPTEISAMIHANLAFDDKWNLTESFNMDKQAVTKPGIDFTVEVNAPLSVNIKFLKGLLEGEAKIS